MNTDGHENRPEQAPGSRRKFLHQVGMGAAATAAIAGFADVAGMTRASAATKRRVSGKEAREIRAQNPRPPHVEKRIQEIRLRKAEGLTTDSSPSYSYCIPTPGQCNGVGGPCKKGYWCHLCCSDYSYCGGREQSCWHQCLPGDYEICNSTFP